MKKCDGALPVFYTVMCLVVAAVFTLLPAGVTLAQCPVICTTQPMVVDDGSGGTGDQIVIAVNLVDSPVEIDAITMEVQFDTNALSYVSCSAGDLTTGFLIFACSENSPGTVRIQGIQPLPGSPIPVGATGTIALLTLDVTCGTCTNGDEFEIEPTLLADDLTGLEFCCGTFTFVGPVQQAVCPGEPSECATANIRVPILVEAPDGLQDIEFHLQYDGISATYLSTETSGLTQNWTMTGTENTAGDITIQGSDIAPLVAANPDTLCYVVFQAGAAGPDMLLTTTGFLLDLSGTPDCQAIICTVPSEESTWGRIKTLWSDR